MQLSAAATGSTSTIAATRPRVAGNVSGRRARAKLRNKIVVLRRLRRRQTQLLICTLQIAHLGVGQEVQNGAAVGVLILHDVAGRVLHRVARVARLRGHVVAHALDAALGVAAALGSLHLHGVELLHQRGLLVGAGQFSGLETVVHVLVDTGKAVQQRGVRGIEAIAQPTVDEIHLALNVGKIGRQHIAVYHAAGIAAVVAPAVITPAKEGKQEQMMMNQLPLPSHPKPPLPPELVGATGIVSMGAPSEERDIEKLLSVFIIKSWPRY